MTQQTVFRTISPWMLMICTTSLPLMAQQRERGGALWNSPQQKPAQMPVIMGVVVMEDGAPLPSGIIMERNCNGTKTREGGVDSSGNFVFQVGLSSTFTRLNPDAGDAHVQGAYGSSDEAIAEGSLSLTGCEIRARAPGYRSTMVVLGVNSVGIIDVGTIVLCPASRMQGMLVSAMDLAAPKAARRQLDRSQNAIRKGEFDKAERLLRSALEVYPPYATAWFRLAQLYESTYRIDDARIALSKAVEADSRFVIPYIHLARIAAQEQRWPDAARLTDQVLELDPIDFIDGYYLNAVSHYYLDELEAAERSIRKVLQMDQLYQRPQASLLLSNIMERKNNTGIALEELQIYRARAGTPK